jgi:hypothetical protein
MNISTCGESGVYEFSGRSNQGIAWSNNCSQLAQYLTKKAASIDASIKWGKSCGEFEHEYPRYAHSSKRQHSQCSDQNQSKKRQRRATVGDLAADLHAVKELLAASIKNNSAEDVYLTFGGPFESVRGIISRTASAARSDAQNCIDEQQEPPPAHSSRSSFHDEMSNTCARYSSADSDALLSDAFNRLQSSASTSSPAASSASSLRLSSHTAPQVTVLFLGIAALPAACESPSAAASAPSSAAAPAPAASAAAESIAAFYDAVDAVAAAHGVSKAEARGDCCICVTGAAGAVPARGLAAGAADPPGDHATRALAFAAALHAALRAAAGPAAAAAVRVGAATGEAAFLVADGGGWGDGPVVSVQGDAVNLAARMHALAGPGAARVHGSAADAWAAEAPGRRPPATERVEC